MAGFNAGGYFAGSHGLLAAVVLGFLVLAVLLADDPAGAAGAGAVGAIAAAALLGAWALTSATWSGAPGRAVLEFDRTLLYASLLALYATLPMNAERMRWMLRGVVLAIVLVCVAGLISRLAPELVASAPSRVPGRLSHPVTYWSTMGLLGVLGLLFCLALTTDAREPRAVRVLGAAACPAVAATAYLTLSRGALAAGAIGLLAYVLLARPRCLAAGLGAVLAPTAVAVGLCYQAQALTGPEPTGTLAVAQGGRVAIAILLCTVAAGGLRALLVRRDARGPRRPRVRMSRPARAGLAVAVVSAGAVAFVTLGGPGLAADGYQRFVDRNTIAETGNQRGRLADVNANGRIDNWDVAWEAFKAQPLHGSGAGTYQLVWERERRYDASVVEAHSLYLETLAELGVVGIVLLAALLLGLLVGLARRMRGEDRALFAIVLAATLAWMVRASLDWDWEMPVVTMWLFALGGAALAVRRGPASQGEVAASRRPAWPLRLAVAAGLVVLAVTPARAALSQRHLNRAVSAFGDRDCPQAIDASLDSIAALGVRPEPFALLAYCDVGAGAGPLALRAIDQAVALDPASWEYRYGRALVRGVNGLDPLHDARAALQRNPLDPRAQRLVRAFATRAPGEWRTRARRAPLP